MRKIPPLFFPLVFTLGVLVGLLLTGMATWADVEATSYGFPRTGGERLSTLYCPMLMTKNEVSIFSIKLVNTTDKKIVSSIRTDIAARFDPISSYTFVELAPGETKRLEAKLGPENLVLGQFIFARASVSAYPLPGRENVCGVFVVDLPTNGRVITWVMTGFTLLGIGIGLYGVWGSQGLSQNKRVDRMRLSTLAILVIVGLLSSFFAWWIVGIIVLVISFLLILLSMITVRH